MKFQYCNIVNMLIQYIKQKIFFTLYFIFICLLRFYYGLLKTDACFAMLAFILDMPNYIQANRFNLFSL